MTADHFALSDTDFSFIGSGLKRPECVLAGASGALYASHADGGVVRIAPDGSQTLIGEVDGEPGRFKTNGFALRRDGSIVFANLGSEGGLWRIAPDGEMRPFLTEVDGVQLNAVNFVWQDHLDRLWFCVSTFRERNLPYDPLARDGIVGLVEGAEARILADGVAFTNECRLNAAGDALYVNQTFSRNTLRFEVFADGKLGNRSVFAEYAPGTYPDGMALDAEGGVWVISVVSNRIYRVTPDGRPTLLFEDCDPDHLAHVGRQYEQGVLKADLIYQPRSRKLANTSSLAFGGPDLRTAYLGCIAGDRIATFRSPVAGSVPSHWSWS
ncbi:SMP-30/gluconolactonase/LRE family protein [Tianweitania sediminis]|uniref:SMP-30/gluconolactonase/LRE family protein n=1 Tax=Tianweitania sediminis TaxID=1502156 RepID=A0A8J7R543_9HYPH|nr:SMP-30/gluconolactonase/LRE family protein [Tianweitania sediminis]MBP0439975.1 SMP-30/gluconolactonase/LRE family protein [Tianweitania sediminis]